MKASVLMITYNQEAFISQAIDSALMQRTDFEFEIVIGEDCSTDRTREIVKTYASKYPEKIISLLHPNNLGLNGKNNFVNTLKNCRGKYIAVLEGDDYWTSPDKLQKQVDFLDRHPDFSMVFHWVDWLENGQLKRKVYGPPVLKDSYTVDDLLEYCNFIPTCSVMFRNGLFGDFPAWYFETDVGDFPLHILNARHGKIGFINESMGVYRRHGGGLHGGKDAIYNLKRRINLYLTIGNNLGLTTSESFQKGLIKQCSALNLELSHSANSGRAEKLDRDFLQKLEPFLPRNKNGTKKRILLTTSAAPSQTPFSTFEKRPPLGIGFLIAVLRNAGHEVFFIDNYLKPSEFLETDYLQRNRIEYVGIYANTICYRDTLRMLHRLDYLRFTGKWKGKIIVGGPHTSVAVETIPDFVDFIVQGEGEEAILDIVEGRARERILRLPPIKDLEQLPMPAWDYFIHQPYRWTVDWLPEKPVFTMNTSRGCPFSCTFCSVCSIWGRRYRYFSAERVIEEIGYLVRHYGAKGIYFREDNFTLNRKRLVRFCESLLEKDIKIQWACESRVDNLDTEVLRLMHRAGARAFYFGVESGSQRMLDFLKKGITVDQVREAFRLCHELGLKTAASIIVGIPGETAEDLRDTEKLLREIKPDVIWQNVFVGIPKSELYSYILDRKLYEFIDDRGLVYLKGHNRRVKQFYKDAWDASIPYSPGKPALSIILSVRNGESHVEKAIRSILTQTFQDFEFIIVDDASTDGTLQIIEGTEDPRIRILKNPDNLGLTKSLNTALRHARGKYIARMDADDISLPHRFETQYHFLENHPGYALVGSSYYEMNDRDEKVSLVPVLLDDAAIREGLKKQNWFGHGSVMIRRDALEQVGGYDERFIFAQDYDLWLRIAEHHKVANMEEPLYCWRRSEGAISQKRQAEQQHFARMAIEEAQKRGKKKGGAKVDQPLVSVIVPTFNRPDMLVETLKSIVDQTFKDFEIIVVNDGGADVEDSVKALNTKRNITYVRHERNRGLAAARNTGIRLARGKYITYLDDDDVYYPDHLETLASYLESSEYKVAYTDAHRAFQEKRNGRYQTVKRDVPYSFDFDYERILRDNFIPVLCVMHEKSCLEEIGFFDETLRSLEDWDLWMRMSREFKFAHIPRVTCAFAWRQDGSTMTSGRSGEMAQARTIVAKRGAQFAREGVFHPDGNGRLEEARGNLASIVILTFNELDYTKRCVESIWKNTPASHEIIFVDNGSTDGTVQWLRALTQQNKKNKLIENKQNLGFAKGCNQGIEAASGEYILLLNNDTVVTEAWLSGMLECLNSSPDIGIVGPMTNNISGIQKVEGTTYKSLNDLEVYAREFRNRNRHRRVASRRLVGFCLLFRRSLVNEIGSLDESFGTGNFEDDDFCLRAALAGYRNVIAGDVFIHHFGSRSFIGNRIEYGSALTGNRKIFDDKWRGIPLDDGLGRRCLVLKNIEEARKQYQLGRLNKAVDLYLEAIKFVPSEPTTYHELTEILIQTRNFKEALDVLREIPPERRSEKTWILTGFAKEGLNEDDAANALAERTLEHPETRAEALNLKGILAYKRASLEEAAAFFQHSIEADPSYGEIQTNLGVVKWKGEPGEEALRFLEKGFILSPDVADVANLYHAAARNLGQFERAEVIFREAKGLHPLNRSISFLLIDLLMSLEKFGEAMEEIERALALFEVDEGFLQAALDVRKKVGPLGPAKKTRAGTISLCMIVKNEERNLIRCLSAIKPAVDEIIVVDTGSTDKTRDIATAFGATVFEIPWRDDFSEARNLSLAKATGDWILVLDADEVIAPCDFGGLRNLTSHVRGGKARPTGFTLTTRNYSTAMNTQGWIPNDGSYANEEAGPGWFPSRKVRLFRNDPRIRFKGSVHELVEDSMIRHKLKIHSGNIPVHHYGILPAKDDVDKREIYYQLGKKKIDESGGNARAIYELAIQAARLRRYDEAVDLWNQFLKSGSTEDLHLAYMNLGHVCLETGRYAEAAEACKKALEIDPELKEAHLNLAMSDFYMGRLSDASAILEKLIAKIPDYMPASALLVAVLHLNGESEKAAPFADRLKEQGTNPAVVFQSYAEKLLSAGHEEDSERLFKAARIIWRDLLKSRGLEASDEEIERVMVIAAGESNPSEDGFDEMTDDLGHQKRKQTQRAPCPQPE